MHHLHHLAEQGPRPLPQVHSHTDCVFLQDRFQSRRLKAFSLGVR